MPRRLRRELKERRPRGAPGTALGGEGVVTLLVYEGENGWTTFEDVFMIYIFGRGHCHVAT